MAQIEWVTSYAKALARAANEKRLLFLDIFDPGCIGCKQMEAVAYQDSAVIQFVNDNLIPVRIPANDPILGTPFKVKWTPTLLIFDSDGEEHYRIHGYYPPEELIPTLLLGMGKARMHQPHCFGACECFDRIIADYPNSGHAPEAVYLSGISRYIENPDDAILIAIHDRLAAEYPESPWLTRADPYRLLKKGR